MADAKRCDRCGKYYNNQDHGSNLSYHDLAYYEPFNENDEYIIPRKVTFTNTCGNGFKFELCPDCMRELIHFIATKED